MAKLKVLGDTVQICSELTFDEIKKAQHYCPECLKLRDLDNNEIFGIGIGNAHYSKHGISFSSRDFDGKMFMSTDNPVTNIHSDKEAEKTLLTETFALILYRLNALEEQVKANIASISELEADTMAAIQFQDEIAMNTVEALCDATEPDTCEDVKEAE